MQKNRDVMDAKWAQTLNRLRNHFFGRDVEPIRPLLRRHCLKLTGDAALAEDLMQDTLLRSLDICRICGGPSNPQAYVLRTATNLWIDELRRRKRARAATDMLVSTVMPAHEPVWPLFEVMAAELPRREYEALILTALHGYSGIEAAELLGTTPGAVKMATSRARKKLRAARALATE